MGRTGAGLRGLAGAPLRFRLGPNPYPDLAMPLLHIPRRLGIAALPLVVAIAAPGCADDGRASSDATEATAAALPALAGLDTVPSPAGPGSGEPNLFSGPDLSLIHI